jgi:HEAT repeat protein
VVAAAVTVLGGLHNPRAVVLLVSALRNQRYSPSRIATAIEGCGADASSALRSLTADQKPQLRYWGAVLLGRQAASPANESTLVRLTADPAPLVRRAALEAIGSIGGPAAIRESRARLSDPIGYVRAHAARALGQLRAVEAAPEIAGLLADPEWWARHAAKQSLVAMGKAVEPVVLACFTSSDPFARNGAAEILQDLGTFERLLAEEAQGPSRADRVRALEHLVASGGVRMTEAILDRFTPVARVRASLLLARLELRRAQMTLTA